MASRREEDPLRTGYASVARVPPQNARKRALSSKYDVHKVKLAMHDITDVRGKARFSIIQFLARLKFGLAISRITIIFYHASLSAEA